MDSDPMHRNSKANDIIKASPGVVFQVEEVPSGLLICARRDAGENAYYWRVTQYLFPWFTLIPPFGPHAMGGHMWIPIDDENCWAWSINFLPHHDIPPEELHEMQAGKGIHVEYLPGTFRPKANKDNDWLIDRDAQRRKLSYSGVAGFSMQDASLQESMGPIQNHAKENLMPTDRAIVLARRRLYQSAIDLQKGIEPPALASRDQRVRAASVVLDRSVDIVRWVRENLEDKLSSPVFTL
jgi:hypothetical protein